METHSNNDKPVIIGIHGLANKPPPDELSAAWLTSILVGLKRNKSDGQKSVEREDFDFSLVYWANRIYACPNHTRSNFNFDSLYNDEPIDIEEESGTAFERFTPSNWVTLKTKTFSVLGKVGDWMESTIPATSSTVQKLLSRSDAAREVNFYYGEQEIWDGKLNEKNEPGDGTAYCQQELRKILREELEQHKGRRVLLIAHSMGSMIANDTLRTMEKEEGHNIHLITIGSPLGLAFVKEKVRIEFGSSRVPNIIQSWQNFADKKDLVAIDPQLADDYQPNEKKVSPKDQFVVNGYVSNISHKPNQHKSYGYLRCPEVSDAIREFLSKED